MFGFAGTVVLTLLLTALSTHFQEPRRFLSMPETALRQRIAVGPLPAYPAESMKAAVTGVVVAEAFFATDGRFETIEILESPDTHIAASVRAAVKGWTLRRSRSQCVVARQLDRRPNSQLVAWDVDGTQEALPVCRFAGGYLSEQGLTNIVLVVR